VSAVKASRIFLALASSTLEYTTTFFSACSFAPPANTRPAARAKTTRSNVILPTFFIVRTSRKKISLVR